MAGVRQHGWRAIPAVRSEYGADTLPDRYRSDGRCRSARTAVHHARRRDRYRRTLRWYDLYILTIALVGYSRGGHHAFGKYCGLRRAGCA